MMRATMRSVIEGRGGVGGREVGSGSAATIGSSISSVMSDDIVSLRHGSPTVTLGDQSPETLSVTTVPPA